MFLLNKTKKLHIYLAEKWCMCKWMKEKKKEVKTTNWTKKKTKKGYWRGRSPCALAHEHFRPLSSFVFSLQFSPHFREKTFW